MENKRSHLAKVFDETIMAETVFVRKDGKLRMIRRQVRIENEASSSERPMFPISKERR